MGAIIITALKNYYDSPPQCGLLWHPFAIHHISHSNGLVALLVHD